MIIVEQSDGVQYDLEKIGLRGLELIVGSPSPTHEQETIQGRDGFIDMGTTYGGRTLTGRFHIKGKDAEGYHRYKHAVYRLFNGKTYFYLINKKDPNKRWRVKTNGAYTPERANTTTAIIEIEFISDSPYAESRGTTLGPIETDETYQITADYSDQPIKYTFTETSFSVWNDSDIAIDPREHYLVIEYEGESTDLTITNTTTGEEWSYTGSSGSNDTITLDGIRSLKNNLTIFSDTNRKLITLDEGWNDFELSGTSGSFSISFDFRFLYI
ncbi:phage tail family protein [Alteribacillus sp. YIM 98480]|uniref:phage tail family protein n=1 Tax=Alteribacillus sp. YIM 98480 TaxID=2606599 RepID=UPI00131AC0C9|nr:phage tail family protein [Alteribacillus sp. YIM 98480]